MPTAAVIKQQPPDIGQQKERACLWQRLRLADRITLASLLLTLGLLSVFGGSSYFALRYSEFRRTQALLEGTAQIARHEIETLVSRIDETVSAAAGQTLVANALADIRLPDDPVRPFLRDAIKPHQGLVSGIALIDYRGEVISHAGESFGGDIDLASLSDTAARKGAGKGQVVYLPSPAGTRILMVYPVIYLPTGRIEGAVVAEIKASHLLPKIKAPGYFPYALEIHTEAGLPIAFQSAEVEEANPLTVELPIRAGAGKTLEVGLHLVTATPRSVAMQPLRKLQVIFAWMILIAAASSFYFSRRFAARIATPITRLSEAARTATAEGHGAIEAVPITGPGELSDLAKSFNAMGQSLKEAHEKLEARVRARTAELLAAREQIREIFDSVVEVVYSASPDFSRMLFVSASAKKIFGFEPERFTTEDKFWIDRIHPEDRSRACQIHNEALNLSGGEIEYRIVHSDGEIRWVRDSFTVLRDPATGSVLRINGTASDITAAIKSDEARRRTEEVLRTLHRAIQASSAGVIISDALAPDTPVVMVNSAFERITGFSQDEVIGRNCRFLQGPDTAPSELENLRSAIRDRRECKVILKNYRKDGKPFWNELSIAPVDDTRGQIAQFVGIMNDITSLVDHQHQILEWAERLAAVFTLSPDGFISIDTQQRVSFANPAVERMTGFSEQDLLGLSIEDLDKRLLARADPRQPYPPLGRALKEMQVAGNDAADAFLYLAQPEPIVLKRIMRPTLPKQDNASCLIYLHDLTREMEVDRMKSEFLTTAAHELRTPMASVMGFAELLLNREFPRALQQEYLGIIHRQAKRLTQLLNDLLDLARIEARRRGALALGVHRLEDIVSRTLQDLMVSADVRKVKVLIHTPLPLVYADEAKITQALTNLLSNAYKYSPGGGEISLQSCSRVQDGQEQIGLIVEDHGIGMRPEELARAFERFYRVDESGAIPGTGLGLALVKEIIETHGGSVTLESRAGLGTRATLWLPVWAPTEPGTSDEHEKTAQAA